MNFYQYVNFGLLDDAPETYIPPTYDFLQGYKNFKFPSKRASYDYLRALQGKADDDAGRFERAGNKTAYLDSARRRSQAIQNVIKKMFPQDIETGDYGARLDDDLAKNVRRYAYHNAPSFDYAGGDVAKGQWQDELYKKFYGSGT